LSPPQWTGECYNSIPADVLTHYEPLCREWYQRGALAYTLSTVYIDAGGAGAVHTSSFPVGHGTGAVAAVDYESGSAMKKVLASMSDKNALGTFAYMVTNYSNTYEKSQNQTVPYVQVPHPSHPSRPPGNLTPSLHPRPTWIGTK
jgi:hypothetical protein